MPSSAGSPAGAKEGVVNVPEGIIPCFYDNGIE